jgi:hypothetical protein
MEQALETDVATGFTRVSEGFCYDWLLGPGLINGHAKDVGLGM